MNPLILNAEPEGYSEEARTILEELGEVVEERITQERLPERVRKFDVLIVRLGLQVTREVIQAGDRLKVVATATTGLDHIDLPAAKEKGIMVLSLQGEREFLQTVPATAEHAWALLLALVRRVPWAFDSVCRGSWDRDGFRGEELHGQRLGILGLGRIGKQVARFGLTFGMEVGAYDPYREGWMDGVHYLATLESFLSWAKVLSVHVPLNEETRGLLDRERLRLLPRGAWVVNTARGAVVDQEALTELLEQGHLAGAALDVLQGEASSGSREHSCLLAYAKTHGNLLITPHLGGATTESMARTELFMAEKLRSYLKSNRLSAGLASAGPSS